MCVGSDGKKTETAVYRKMNYFAVLAVIVLVLPFSVLAVDQHPHCTPGDCGEGEKKDTDGRCIPCDNDTFMHFTKHACTSCFQCDKANKEGEIKVANCTDRKDAIVTCQQDYFHTEHNTPETRSCLKCKECSDNEYVSRNCTETRNTLCIPNTSTRDDETTRVRNDLSATETASTVNETTVSQTSNFNTTTFSTTAPAKAEGDNSNEVLKIVLPIAAVVVLALAVAVGIYIYRRSRRSGLLAVKPQLVKSGDIELGNNNTA